MKSRRLLLSIALSLGLAGCMPFGRTDPYWPVSGAGWQGQVASAIPSPSRQELKGPLTLQRCIRIALAQNPTIGTRAWEVRAAEQQRNIAAAARLPNITAHSAFTHYLDNQRLLPGSRPGEAGTYAHDILEGNVTLTVPIYTAGRITSRIEAADLLRRAAAGELARLYGQDGQQPPSENKALGRLYRRSLRHYHRHERG